MTIKPCIRSCIRSATAKPPASGSLSLRQQSINIMTPLSGRIWVVGSSWEGLENASALPITGAGQSVLRWRDIIASDPFSQTSIGVARPTSSAALTPKSLNFDGGNDRLTTSTTYLSGTAYTLIIASKSTVMGAARTTVGASASSSYASIGHDSGQQWTCKSGDAVITSAVSAGSLSIVELRRDGSSAEAWVNGASIGTASPTLGGTGIAPMFGALSTSGTASEFFGGQIAFVAMVDSALSTANRKTIANYAAEHCGMSAIY